MLRAYERPLHLREAQYPTGDVVVRLGKGNADEAGQSLAKVDASESEAGWTGMGYVPGHASDVRNPVEAGWGGCSYPVGADGQYGGRERKRVRCGKLRTEASRRSQIGISRHPMTARGVLEC